MPARHIRVDRNVPDALRAGVARLAESLDVPQEFSADARAEAERAASGHDWPERDATDIAFVTIDPPGSTDLDQAVFIERAGDGYLVRYAIADLARFVTPGGALDAEVHERGTTLYAPHARTPLHPAVISEGAASLLPGQDRPALLWELTLDAAGALTHTEVGKARLRSREQLTYAGVQEMLDAGTASENLQLLREVGLLREEQERQRGGVSLPVPEQEIVVDADGWRLEFRSGLPIEGWNAQISLLTGMAAAQLMLGAKGGVVRTLPPARQMGIDRLRRVAKGLKIAWPGAVTYPEFVRSLDPANPRHAAMLNACTTLFRGAGYAAFDGEVPAQPLHGALAAAYAHCTAPLRRLVDRYVGEICVAVCAGVEVPGWVRAALPGLPETMAAADARAKKYERGIVDLTEALVLSARVGETFEATVIDWDADRRRGIVQVSEPAVQAAVVGKVELGSEITATLVRADTEAGVVEFRAS